MHIILGFISLYQRGKLPVQRPGSGTTTFDEINQRADRLPNGSVLRQALRPHR
jgi:Zn-dependent alcohol dehydrogenase